MPRSLRLRHGHSRSTTMTSLQTLSGDKHLWHQANTERSESHKPQQLTLVCKRNDVTTNRYNATQWLYCVHYQVQFLVLDKGWGQYCSLCETTHLKTSFLMWHSHTCHTSKFNLCHTFQLVWQKKSTIQVCHSKWPILLICLANLFSPSFYKFHLFSRFETLRHYNIK